MFLMKNGARIQTSGSRASTVNLGALRAFISSTAQHLYEMGSRLSGETEGYKMPRIMQLSGRVGI